MMPTVDLTKLQPATQRAVLAMLAKAEAILSVHLDKPVTKASLRELKEELTATLAKVDGEMAPR